MQRPTERLDQKQKVAFSLKLEGLPSEDVPEIMAQYRTHTTLALPEGTSEADHNRRAIKILRLITKGAVATSLDLILSKSLEWRPEQQIAALKSARRNRNHLSPQNLERMGNGYDHTLCTG